MKLKVFLEFIQDENLPEDLQNFDIVFKDNDSIFQINSMNINLTRRTITLEYRNE